MASSPSSGSKRPPGIAAGRSPLYNNSSGVDSPATPVDETLRSEVSFNLDSTPPEPRAGMLMGPPQRAPHDAPRGELPLKRAYELPMTYARAGLRPAQAAEIVERSALLRMMRQSESVVLYGWRLIWKLREVMEGAAKKSRQAQGDLTVCAPTGERFHSIVGLKRAFGFVDDEHNQILLGTGAGAEVAAKRVRREGKEVAGGPQGGGSGDGGAAASSSSAASGWSCSSSLPMDHASDFPTPLVGKESVGEVYIVDRLLDHRWEGKGRQKRKQYLVRWQGYARPPCLQTFLINPRAARARTRAVRCGGPRQTRTRASHT
jgi:hypothetical protein